MRQRVVPPTVVPPTAPASPPGRPRSVDAHTAILDAAIDLTREVGFDALAMEAIAKRAGVGKTTVYRWWSTKEALLAEALARLARTISVPDLGSLEADLLAVLRGTMRMYLDPATKTLLPALVAAMARSGVVATAMRSGIIKARRDAMREVIERAITRAELPRTTDVDLALDLLAAPLFYRSLVMGKRINEPMLAAVVSIVVAGLRQETRSNR